MAKGQSLSRYQQGVIKRYYEHRDTMAIQTLGEIASDLYLCEDPTKSARLWERAAKALTNTEAEPARIETVLAERDVVALSRLVQQLTAAPPSPSSRDSAPAPAPTPPTTRPVFRSPAAQSPPAADPTDPQVLKRAMKAFRKRLKLTRLDEESKLGVGPLSSAKRSGVVAITPPHQYPAAVWQALVQQGRLTQAGKGFYALAEEQTKGGLSG